MGLPILMVRSVRLISQSASIPRERPIQGLVREPEIGSKFLERSRQSDGPAIGLDIDGEKVPDAIAGGMNVAALEPRAQRHDLLREHGGESLQKLRIVLEFAAKDGLRIQSNHSFVVAIASQ